MENSKVQRTIFRSAEIIDRETGVRYIDLVTKNVNGDPVCIVVRPGELMEARQVVAKLLDQGANVAINKSTLAEIAALSTQVANAQLVIGKRGWNYDPLGFGTQEGMLGPNAARYRMDPNIRPSLYGKIRRAGNLAGARLVAEKCFDSVALTIGLCAGYASIVSSFLKMNPFVILLYGSSKSGKTTAALLAVSHFGHHLDGHLLSISDTATGIDDAALQAAAWPIVLDETATVQMSAAQLVSLVRERVFHFSQGRERVRSSTYNNGASGRALSGLVIITGVNSISSMAKSARIDMTDGMASRLLEIRVQQSRNESCLDIYPPGMPETSKKEHGDRKLGEIRDLLKKNHGLTHEVFIKKIIENPDAAEADMRRLMKEFRAHPDTLRSSAIAHAINSYSTLYAAGRLAMDWGLMPKKPRRLLSYLQRGLQRLEWDGKEDERIASKAVKRLILAIEAAPKRSALDSKGPSSCPIFKRSKADGTHQCVVSVTEMRRLAGDERTLALLFERLLQRKIVTVRHANKSTLMMKIQTNVSWPDGEKYKAIIVDADDPL